MGAITITDERGSVCGGAATTTVTIHDEATRQALLSCLWTALYLRVANNDCLADAAYGAAYEAARVDEDRGSAEYVEEILRDLLDVTAAVQAVRSASVGALVELSISDKEWTDGLDLVRHAVPIEGDPFSRPAERRAQIIAVREAAARLEAELNPTEAVA